MRTPIRSEPDAFRFTIGAALIIGVSVLIGWLAAPLVGVAVLAVACIIAALAYLLVGRRDRAAPLRAAAHEPHPQHASAGTRHVLVIANETLSGPELREKIAVDRQRVEIDVLAPILGSRLHLGLSDIDRELEQARTRLQRSLAWAREQGIPAHGKVGDPGAMTAIEDELREFGADEVIVVTHPRERETRQEHAELERLRRELDVPVTHVTIGGG